MTKENPQFIKWIFWGTIFKKFRDKTKDAGIACYCLHRYQTIRWTEMLITAISKRKISFAVLRKLKRSMDFNNRHLWISKYTQNFQIFRINVRDPTRPEMNILTRRDLNVGSEMLIRPSRISGQGRVGRIISSRPELYLICPPPLLLRPPLETSLPIEAKKIPRDNSQRESMNQKMWQDNVMKTIGGKTHCCSFDLRTGCPR